MVRYLSARLSCLVARKSIRIKGAKMCDADGVQPGTWLNSDSGSLKGGDDLASNVTRLSRAIKPASSDAIPQIVYYHYGVGMTREA
jgi:hypothetical protein